MKINNKSKVAMDIFNVARRKIVFIAGYWVNLPKKDDGKQDDKWTCYLFDCPLRVGVIKIERTFSLCVEKKKY